LLRVALQKGNLIIDIQYGNFAAHIIIDHTGDALQVIDQVLAEMEFDPESVQAVLEALKDAVLCGILHYAPRSGSKALDDILNP
jgi:hypothetical protein